MEEIKEEIENYLKTNDNKFTTQNLCQQKQFFFFDWSKWLC